METLLNIHYLTLKEHLKFYLKTTGSNYSMSGIMRVYETKILFTFLFQSDKSSVEKTCFCLISEA